MKVALHACRPLIPIIGLFIVFTASCEKVQAPQPSSALILPKEGSGITLFSPLNASAPPPDISNQISPHILIPEDYIPHQVYEYSIDDDPQNEQLIAYKRRDSQDDIIGVMVVDYDPSRDSYFLSWQGDTLSTGLKSFNLYTDDVTGDQRLEIIASGVNNLGKQTLDIFRQEDSTGFGLQFSPVLSIQADIAVEINNVARNRPAEALEFQESRAFTVRALNNNLESENSLDMIQSTYAWSREENRYLLTFSQSISGSEVEQDQLAELYAGGLNDFHDFVDGLWQQESGNQIILFSKRDDSIQLATTDRQLHFQWLNSARWGIGSSFWAYIQNEIISNVTQRMQISILDLNTLLVQFSGETSNVFWSGSYQRILNSDNPLQEDSLQERDGKVLYPYEISGLYVSDNDWEMFFAAPYITLRTQEEERNGGYVIFQLNDQNIFEIVFFDESEIITGKQYYTFSFEQNNEGNQLQKRIYLQEASLTSYGARAISEEVILLEQVIQFEG